ncbi:MAG: nitronate monooxygenase [Oscillospiraceae bacterium]|nr:nitronate monooxygenase [Oscillospiraceae bacterium]
MTTKITKLLGIEYPILQGGMAWISEHKLAAAVSNAGGAGIIAGGNAPPDLIREEIRAAKGLTSKPFGLNIMLMSPNSDELAQIAIDEKIAFVTTGAGNPGKYIEAFKSAGVKVIPVIPSVGLAKRMERAGADAVIAEGGESGGHIGENSTFCLVPQVVDALDIPVLAAGGIADGRGLAASLMLGATGVQIGTRFLAAHECQIHENYKKLVLDAKDTDSIVTGRFTGHPCRGVKTKFSRYLLEMERSSDYDNEKSRIDKFEEITAGALRKAAVDGNLAEGSFLCGSIAGMVNKEQSAAEIISDITESAKSILEKRYV